MYLFIPSALVGFLIGLLIWIAFLIVLRSFGVVKQFLFPGAINDEEDVMNFKVKYVKNGDPWIDISDLEKFNSLNGATQKTSLVNASYSEDYEFERSKTCDEVFRKDRMSCRQPIKRNKERKRNVSN